MFRGSGQRWMFDEDRQLLELLKQGKSRASIAKLLGRSIVAVSTRSITLKNSLGPSQVGQQRARWTSEEDERLLDWWRAVHLGRKSQTSLAGRRAGSNTGGLRFNAKWGIHTGGRVGEAAFGSAFHVAALSSLSAPRATILSASSGNGRCSAFASSHGARIQTSRSSSVVRITGMAFG